MKTLLVFLLFCLRATTHGQRYLENVKCDSYVDYLPLDEDYKYIPYFVTLNRCQGANYVQYPQNHQCVASANSVFNISVANRHTFQPASVAVTNETKCEFRCMLNQTSCTKFASLDTGACVCKCDHESEPQPSPCTLPFMWSQSHCDCICPKSAETTTCPINRQYFDKDICGCTCKQKFAIRCAKRKQYLTQKTCQCTDFPPVQSAERKECTDGVTGGMLALIMILELVLILFLYALLYFYCYKQRYLPKKQWKQYNVQTYADLHSPQQRCDANANPPPSGTCHVPAVVDDHDDFTHDESSISLDKNMMMPDDCRYYDESDSEKSPLRLNDYHMYNDETTSEDIMPPPSYVDIHDSDTEYSAKTLV